MSENENKRSMTVQEAGRRGGLKVKATQGPNFFRTIGKKGGERVRDTRGREHYERIGKLGGQKVKEAFELARRGGMK